MGSMESLKKLSNCGICLEYMDTPRILNCHHSFCISCLSDMYSKTIGSSLMTSSNIRCPECRVLTPLKAGGIQALPSDFRHNQLDDLLHELQTNQNSFMFCSVCIDSDGDSIRSKVAQHCCTTCGDLLCETCWQKHKQVPIFSSHELVPLDGKSKEASHHVCPKHRNKTLQFFCETCQQVVCTSCITSLHARHKVSDGPTRLKHLHSSLNVMRRRINDKIELTKILDYQPDPKGLQSDIDIAFESVEQDIKQHVRSTIKDIKQQEEGLLTCLRRKREMIRENTDPEALRHRQISELKNLDKCVKGALGIKDVLAVIDGRRVKCLQRTVDSKLDCNFPHGYIELPKDAGDTQCVAFSPGSCQLSIGSLSDSRLKDMRRDIYKNFTKPWWRK